MKMGKGVSNCAGWNFKLPDPPVSNCAGFSFSFIIFIGYQTLYFKLHYRHKLLHLSLCPLGQRDKMSDYLTDRYITEGSTFPPTTWAWCSLTTNCCESFYSHQSTDSSSPHPNIHVFVKALLDIQRLTYINWLLNYLILLFFFLLSTISIGAISDRNLAQFDSDIVVFKKQTWRNLRVPFYRCKL